MSKLAVYPGTFDPLTNGHLDIIERSAKQFEHVLVAVSEHQRKDTLFTLDERVAAIQAEISRFDNVSVAPFTNLLVDFAIEQKADAIIRGLRVNSDFEYEFRMARYIEDQAPDMEVIYLMAKADTLHISSSSVKEIAHLGGKVENYVPDHVLKMLESKNGNN